MLLHHCTKPPKVRVSGIEAHMKLKPGLTGLRLATHLGMLLHSVQPRKLGYWCITRKLGCVTYFITACTIAHLLDHCLS